MTRERHPRRRFLRAGAAFLAVTAARPGGAAAQQDWLRKGLEGLGSTMGGDGGTGGAMSSVEIGRGLKEALKLGTERVIGQVGQPGGYLKDAAIHIPLPGFLGRAQELLQAAGAAGLLDDLEVRLNRAAEAAAPQARDIFFDAIGQMTLADARQILDGPDDAATRYFQRTMTPELKAAFRPVVDRELANAGAIQAFDSVTERYAAVPFAPALGRDAKDRLVDHALEGATDGIFHYLAREEKAIRQNPAARTTDLLKKVFG